MSLILLSRHAFRALLSQLSSAGPIPTYRAVGCSRRNCHDLDPMLRSNVVLGTRSFQEPFNFSSRKVRHQETNRFFLKSCGWYPVPTSLSYCGIFYAAAFMGWNSVAPRRSRALQSIVSTSFFSRRATSPDGHAHGAATPNGVTVSPWLCCNGALSYSL